jgi:L-iditol 2-dehydrogenase
MRAAVLEELERMVVREVPDPRIGPGEILVRVRACAVCGSDVRIYHHGNPRVQPPHILGHEIAGDVIAVGAGVEQFQVGDRVATAADVPCGVCEYCRAGMGNNCAINYALGYQFPGGFAELLALNRVTVSYGPVHHIPHGMSYETATLAEPLACCLNGLERSFLAPGDSVLIIGAGPAGILLAEAAKALGATQVILAQRSARRLELARAFRADALIATQQQDLQEAVMDLTRGRGWTSPSPPAPRPRHRSRRFLWCGRVGGSTTSAACPAAAVPSTSTATSSITRNAMSTARTAASPASTGWRWSCWRRGR